MYLIALLLISLACAVVGQLLLFCYKVKIETTYRPLTSLVLGLLILVTIYSIIITQGRTVHLGFFIIAILAWWLLREEGYFLEDRADLQLFYRDDIKQYLFFVGIALGWQLYFYTVFQCYTYGQEGTLSLIFEDVLFYSAIGEWISNSGQESTLGNSLRLDPSFVGMVPYHYFEIYFGQLLTDVFLLNALKSHIYLTNTFSVALISYSTYVFAKELVGKNASSYFLFGALLSVWYSGIKLPIPLREAGHYIMPLLELNTMKFGFLFLFFLIGTHMALIKSPFFVLPFLIIPIMSYTLLPAFLIALPLMGIGSVIYYKYKQQNPKLIYAYVIGGTLLTLFLVFIYKFWGMSSEYQAIHINVFPLIKDVLTNWRTSIGIIVGTHVYFWIDYIPYIIITGLFWWRWGRRFEFKDIPLQLLIIPILFFSATLSYAILLHVTQESFQIHAIVIGFVGNLAIIFTTTLTYQSLQKNKKWYLLAQIPLLVYLVYFTLFNNSRTYNRERSGVISLKAAQEILPLIPNNNARIATLDSTLRKHEVYPFGAWLAYYKQQITLTSISEVLLSNDFDDKPWVKDDFLRVLRISTPFYRYVQQLQNEQKNVDLRSAQLAFLKYYQMDYVLVDNSYKDTIGLLKDLELKCDNEIGKLYQVPK